MSTKQYSLVVLLTVVGILSSFFSGYYFKNILLKTSVEEKTDPSNLKPYFSDEIVLISKEKPHYTLIAYNSRRSKDKFYSQSEKLLFFDGKEWKSNAINIDSEDLNIAQTPMIPKWEITVDPSLVLKQSVKGEAKINNNSIHFEVPLLQNELGVRSLDGYTLFRSESSGKLTINGKEYDSYVLYSRTYSYNASIDLIAVTEPLGINTDYIAFWDNDGNFYNIDETNVDNKNKGRYKKHSIAIFKDKDERVQKSFNLSVQKNKDIGYKINVFEKINRSFTVNFLNSVNKSVTESPYNWKTGQIEGEVKLENGKTIKGFGIYEYIYQ